MQNFMLKQSRKFFAEKVSRKLSKYADSCLLPLKNLKNELEHRDVVFVTQQQQRWTVNELDFHSDAFAYYLTEQGITGEKVLFWSDVNHSLEYISAAVGTIKAGSTIVTTEFENWEDVQKVLKESGADVLVVSPFVQAENNKTRIDQINEAIPELSKMRYGDLFKTAAFPELKQIIQISHKTISGTEKFKHCLNYSNSLMTNLSLPELKNENVFEMYTDSGVKTINHQDCLQRITEFRRNLKSEYTNIVNSAPIFFPANFTLGLLGGLAAKSYNVIPGNYNFVDIVKLIETQRSPVFIGEDGILDLQIAHDKVEEVKGITAHVEEVVIFSNEANLKNKKIDAFTKLFANSKIQFYDEYSFRKLD